MVFFLNGNVSLQEGIQKNIILLDHEIRGFHLRLFLPQNHIVDHKNPNDISTK